MFLFLTMFSATASIFLSIRNLRLSLVIKPSAKLFSTFLKTFPVILFVLTRFLISLRISGFKASGTITAGFANPPTDLNSKGAFARLY